MALTGTGWRLELKYEPRDLWIGLYWDAKIVSPFHGARFKRLDFYVCILPMLPVHIWRSELL